MTDADAVIGVTRPNIAKKKHFTPKQNDQEYNTNKN